MIAGLESVTAGDIGIDGRDVNDVPPARARRRDGVPVLRALSAHDGARRTCRFGLRMAGMPRRRDRAAASREAAAHPADRAAARAQAASSSPAASASASRSAAPSCASPRSSCSTSRCPTSTPRCACRCASRSRACTPSSAPTMIYVTHDQVEAMTLADRIVVLNQGVVEQVGAPLELYDRRATASSPASSARRR